MVEDFFNDRRFRAGSTPEQLEADFMKDVKPAIQETEKKVEKAVAPVIQETKETVHKTIKKIKK
jgi:hypothetical protein